MIRRVICPDCGATFVQTGPIEPACTYCAERDGWFQDAEGFWLPPYMKESA